MASPLRFNSFWQAGYEGADHLNAGGRLLSMNDATGHAARAREDYRLLADFGIRTVRESVGWRLVERDGAFDFSSLETRAAAARDLGIQICWTFLHYGWPADIDFYSSTFIGRFARFCRRTTRFLEKFTDQPPIYSPINEISFHSWALDVGYFPARERPPGGAKRQLVRAAIAGCDAIWDVDPRARVLHVDPVVNVAAQPNAAVTCDAAAREHALQFEAWDMLAGRTHPELGGTPRHLDLIGVNYYHDNQWEVGSGARLAWHLGDARRAPLSKLLKDVFQRYGRPLVLSETSHVGSGRGAWLQDVAAQIRLATQQGVDCRGICLYPVIDRPDWDREHIWHRSGLWDIEPVGVDPQARVLNAPYARALRQAQRSDQFYASVQPSYFQGNRMSTILVFSHLRWDFVFQRPQHLLTRLARHHRIIFFEEPVFHEGAGFLAQSQPAPNVTVYRPHTAIPAAGFHDDQLPLLQAMLSELLTANENPIVWFYTPMALPLLQSLTPSLVVYDCMDELAAFKNPPRQMLQRETALLASADLVFTGGPSLYEAKRQRHPNAYCFPSSVDVVHFEQALDRSNGHPLQAAMRRPRLGFYGVIDERFDTELIAALATEHPEWQIVLVGPIVKIDPASLPHRSNIHYLGQQPYQALPQFLAGWDVCLLPFAINEATRFISPTKVLEYMAAELPIVSTAIKDVAEPYGDIVAIAHDHRQFIDACAAALQQTPAQTAALQASMRAVVAATSWDDTAEQMHGLLSSALAGEQTVAPAKVDTTSLAKVNRLPTPAAMQAVECVIAGGGPTGLSAAYHYGAGALLLEKNHDVGGWCRSIKDKGFTFDYAGHIMFSNDPYVLKLYEKLLGGNLHWQNREAWVYSKNVYTRYPFQGALYGLPPAVIKECIVGAMEARFGDLPATPKNFEAFIYKVWGSGIAKHFAVPYNLKLWTVPLSDMETSWLGGRVPLPDLGEIIEGALEPVGKPMGPNARFGYPLHGGFEALVQGFMPHIQGKVETGADIVQVLPEEHAIALADGRRFRYDHLISTLPLPELIKLTGKQATSEVVQAAQGLRHVSVRCVNLGIGRAKLTDKHWVYYPEETIFHRIFVQGNASPHCNPPGGFGLTCEITYSPTKPLPVDGEALIARCIADCIKVGMFNANDVVITANLVDMPYAYVLYDHARAANVAMIRDWLAQYDISLSGRYSEWEYYNSDHAFVAGKRAAETVLLSKQRAEAACGLLSEIEC
ncbi:MAG: NAD(P)-binding protein [Burkholderiaceae bacterium]